MQKISDYIIPSQIALVSSRFGQASALVLFDRPEALEITIQMRYLNDSMGIFLRNLMRVYGNEELSEEERAKLRRYLERVFDAKDAFTPRDPEGGFYPRKI